MTTYCSDKDVNKFIKSLIKQGWTYTKGKKHGKLSPDFTDMVVIISSSPSDRLYLTVLKQFLRRNNLIN